MKLGEKKTLCFKKYISGYGWMGTQYSLNSMLTFYSISLVEETEITRKFIPKGTK